MSNEESIRILEEKQRKAEQKKARYQYLKARGRCTVCGEMDAYTLAGRVRCARCFEKDMQYHKEYASIEENRNKSKAYLKRLYEERKANGICTYCSKRKAEAGKTKCPQCLEKDRRRHRNPDVLSKDVARDIGLCTTCLKHPAMEGKHLCETCYQKACASLEEGRKRIKNRKPLVWGKGLLSSRRGPEKDGT